MENKNGKKLFAIVILLIMNLHIALADGWTADKPSHSTLYADTLTSKTDSSPVSIADTQGLFVTGNITTLGKVGIGTTNPAGKLHIAAGQGAIAQLIIDGTDTASAVQAIFRNSDASVSGFLEIIGGTKVFQMINPTAGGKLTLATTNDAGTRVTGLNMDKNGNVGIGTTSPTYKLHVSAGGYSVFENTVYVGDGVGDSYITGAWSKGLTLGQYNFNPAVGVGIRIYYPTSRVVVGTTGQNSNPAPSALTVVRAVKDSSLYTTYNAGADLFAVEDVAGGVVTANHFVIKDGGNVGIGTTNPTSKLHVIGKGTFTGGVDPPYVSFSDESHESIRQYAKEVEEHEKVMQFWNSKTHRMEIYVIDEDKFYTINGELIEK